MVTHHHLPLVVNCNLHLDTGLFLSLIRASSRHIIGQDMRVGTPYWLITQALGQR